jgi:ribonuclease T2
MDLRTKLRYALLAVAVAATVTSAALAQRPYQGRGTAEGRNIAGQFDYYALVLSWSPSHCAATQGSGADLQCGRSDGKRYSFVLHGLWPQYAPRGWPQDCPVRGRPFVPRPVITSMLDIMPSDKLVIHEYRKHGTCSGLEPAQYYDLSRKLFTSVTIPDDYRNTFEAVFVSPDDLAREFMKVNPWLKPNMIGIACGGPGNRLTDVRICFSKEGQPTACTRNEDQRKMCSAPKVYLPPVRSTKQGDPPPSKAPTTQTPRSVPNARNI